MLKQFKAGLRDSLILIREFRWPLIVLFFLVSGGGYLYWSLSTFAGDQGVSLAQSIYHVLGLVFLQPSLEFPHQWYLQIFYFVVPILGIGILAQGIADFGVLFFNRKARSKEWEMAIMSTLNEHVILIGLGHLGFRVVQYLSNMNQEVAVVELKPDLELLAQIRAAGIPVIQGDGMRESILEAAGVRRARSIILCMQNDSTNLQIALKARSVNPEINVILRIFDDDFASALEQQFGFHALSATSMAAPAFAASAAEVNMTRPIVLDGALLSLANLQIKPGNQLDGLEVGRIEVQYRLSVVLLRRDGVSNYHPTAETIIQANDNLAVLGGPKEITHLSQANLQTRRMNR
jgi:Trk K+ transport system NAD-binding subunit